MLLLALGLLVELHDAELQLEQRPVDILGLLYSLLVVVARLVHALRASQVDQMQFGDGSDVRALFLGLYLDDENTVGAGRGVVLWSL